MGWRCLRGGMFALLAVGVAVLAHAAGDATLPPAATTLALGAGLAIAATLLAGREWRLPGLLAAGAGVQLGIHLAFAGPSLPGGGASDSLLERLLCHPPAAAAPSLHLPTYLAGLADPRPSAPTAVMLAGHLLATVLTAWWLWRGERALWAARRLLAAWVRRYLPVHAPARPRQPVRPVAAPAPRRYLLRHAVAGRGPPVAGFA